VVISWWRIKLEPGISWFTWIVLSERGGVIPLHSNEVLMRRLYESAKAHGVSEAVLQLLLSESKVMGNEYIEKVRDTRRRDHDDTRISFDD
jgi:hypothetical protein